MKRFLLLFPLVAHAEDLPVYPAAEVVVTASRIPQPQSESLASTTVINSEQIRNSQAADLATILRTVPGLEISQNGGFGNAASIFLRGANSNETLVLVDGVRINSATTGLASIQDLMLDQIDRIEVVRGNVSSLYGSDAIGGVVQIFTRRGAPGFNLNAGAGSLGTGRFSVGYGGEVGDTGFNFQLSSFKTNGISAINPALASSVNPSRDGYDNVSFSGNLHHSLSLEHQVSMTLFGTQARNQFDNAFGLPTDVNVNRDRVEKFSLASDDRVSDAWQSHLQWATGIDHQMNYLNGLPTPFGALYQTTNRQLSWQNTFDLGGESRLLVGAERLGQYVQSDVAGGYAVSGRVVNSVYAGVVGRRGAHELRFNLREDRNSQYGVADTGLLGYGFDINENFRATASYSTAFKAPAFNELYYPAFGNPLLLPEHSRNAEAGIHYSSGAQNFDAVYFNNRIRDLIAYAPNPVNSNQARIDGLEFIYSGRFSATSLNASLTAQNPRDLSAGTLLQRRARVHGSLGANRNFGQWRLGGEWLYSGKRLDSDIVTFAPVMLGSYNLFNLTANYSLDRHLSLNLRADNLFDERYMLAQGYNTLGRTLFLSLSYR